MTKTNETATGTVQKAAVYVRRSDDLDLERQVEALQQQAEERGFEVVAQYVDAHLSNVERSRMLDDLATSGVKMIVVARPSHLANSSREFDQLQVRLAANGIELVCCRTAEP